MNLLSMKRVVLGAGLMLTAAGSVRGGLPDWTLVADQTVVSTPSESLTRSLRRVVLNDNETLMYATFLQKSLGAGVREYTLAGDPPVATPGAFFNVTGIAPSGTDHQPEGLDVDDRGFVYVGSSKDGTSGDNARIIVLPTGLGSTQVFPLTDIDFVGTTGETIGDLRIRKVAGIYQLYVSRHHAGSAYVERYIVGGSSVGSLTLTLDPLFNGTGRYSLITHGGFPSASNLRGIDVADDGTIFVVSRENNRLYKISSDLTTVSTVSLTLPMGVSLYDGRAFVTQYSGNSSSIAEVDQATLSVISVFDAFDDYPRDPGSDGNEAGYAGIHVDSGGHVYLSDQLYFRSSAESRDRVLRSSSFAPAPPAMLTLEVDSECPDDWDSNTGNGYQVAVELWMRDLPSNATGFQAFLLYDPGVMTFNSTLSSYTTNPFPLHLTPIALADMGGGSLWLDGSDSLGDPGVSTDALLATLVFDVDVDCSTTSVMFDTTFIFNSELSFNGVPLPTDLSDSPAFTLDDTPPTLDPCPNIVQAADAGSGDGCQDAVVFFSDPGAVDDCSAITVDCVPASGSVFPVGTTTVTCTATDECGNESECMFDVTVTDTNLVEADVELVGVYIHPLDRCIHFVLDDCDATADATLTFLDHDSDDANMNGIDDATEGGSNLPATPVRAVGAIVEVPCGTWSQLCAKDEQHTLWDTAGLVVSGANYATTSLLSLLPGDNDNDGDVDINDVTFIVATFGGAELPGGCPWDGTRGADFSNNGNVGSEDYSLLSANWLSLTMCSCTAPQVEPSSLDHRLAIDLTTYHNTAVTRLDLNLDGVFDYQDLEIFERRHRLTASMSIKLNPKRTH